MLTCFASSSFSSRFFDESETAPVISWSSTEMVAEKKIRRGSEVIMGCGHNLANSDDLKNHKQQKQRVDLLFFCDQCSHNFKGNADMKMHKRGNHAGEAKFWRSPELLSHLLTYLDVSSTMALAMAHPLTVSLLQNMFIWRGVSPDGCLFTPVF